MIAIRDKRRTVSADGVGQEVKQSRKSAGCGSIGGEDVERDGEQMTLLIGQPVRGPPRFAPAFHERSRRAHMGW